MLTLESTYRAELQKELQQIPPEYFAPLLKMLRAFRESVTLLPAEESFRQGWEEAFNGDVHPIEEL